MEVNGQLHAPAILPLGTHWIREWVDSRAGPGAVEKRKISCPYQESNPTVQPIACPYAYWAILA
jgi:hypothetical protein